MSDESCFVRPMSSAYADVQGTEPEFTTWAYSFVGGEFKGEGTKLNNEYRIPWPHNIVLFGASG